MQRNRLLPFFVGFALLWLLVSGALAGRLDPARRAAVFAILLGPVLLIAGGVIFYRTRQFIAAAQTATGTVVDIARRARRFRGGWINYPVVRFTAGSGEEFEVTSSFGTDPPTHQLGQAVRVFYDPHDPGRARIDSFFSLWGTCTFLVGIGLLFTVVAVVLFVVPVRPR